MCYHLQMIAVIGLGNPGKEYTNTRHNVGWQVLDVLANGESWEQDKYLFSEKCTISIDGQPVMLLKPQTFMNDSGKVLAGLKKLDSEIINKIIVVHDEIDMPIGTVKIAYARGDGGHNGIKSINEYYGGKEYTRVRVGISKTGENGEIFKPNVLGEFDKADQEILKTVLTKSADAVRKIVTVGKDAAANEINTK